MKFLMTGAASQNGLLKAILFIGLVYLSISHVSGILLHANGFGLSYNAVVEHYLGSEETFKNPVSLKGLLEMTHMHMFSMGIAVLLAGHLAAFTGLSGRIKAALAITPFASGLLDTLSGWLIVYVSGRFAYLKLASLVVFEVSFALLLAVAFFSLKVYAGKPERLP